MSQKKNRRIVGVMGIWGFVLAGTGMYVPFVVAESNLSVISNAEQKDQKIQLTQKGETGKSSYHSTRRSTDE